MVAMTANWPAMTRNVWPRSRRLSSASTWSGVRLRSSGGSREFAIVSLLNLGRPRNSQAVQKLDGLKGQLVSSSIQSQVAGAAPVEERRGLGWVPDTRPFRGEPVGERFR